MNMTTPARISPIKKKIAQPCGKNNLVGNFACEHTLKVLEKVARAPIITAYGLMAHGL